MTAEGFIRINEIVSISHISLDGDPPLRPQFIRLFVADSSAFTSEIYPLLLFN
jgi:hypothetical protein